MNGKPASGLDPYDDLSEYDLARKKLILEDQKLQSEIRKLERESRWTSIMMPTIVSISAVLVTGMVGAGTWYNSKQLNEAESEKAKLEAKLKCVETAASVTKNIFETLLPKFEGLPSDQKIALANDMMALYPRPTAYRIITSLAQHVKQPTDAPARAQYDGALTELQPDADGAGETDPCGKIPPALPMNSQPTATGAAATTAETGQLVLSTFYRVTRPQDSATAELIASGVEKEMSSNDSPQFRTKGVEVVQAAAGLKQLEVRYYHNEEQEAANQLLSLVEQKAGLKGEIQNRGDTFPNVPPATIDVWLPPLKQDSAFCYQQELKSKNDPGRHYGVFCQPTRALCQVQNGPSPDRIASTNCDPTPLDHLNVKLIPGGYKGSGRYQYQSEPFAPPFPQLP